MYIFSKHNTHENGKYVTCGVCQIDSSDVLGGKDYQRVKKREGL